MLSLSNKTSFSLFLIGSLLQISTSNGDMIEAMAENLPMDTPEHPFEHPLELCSPFDDQRLEQDRFTFVELQYDFGDGSLVPIPDIHRDNFQDVHIHRDIFVETYNKLAVCNQDGAIRGIYQADVYAAVFSNATWVVAIEKFYCNSCGNNDWKLFADDEVEIDELEGAAIEWRNNDREACHCKGPTRQAFAEALAEALADENLKGVRQLPPPPQAVANLVEAYNSAAHSSFTAAFAAVMAASASAMLFF